MTERASVLLGRVRAALAEPTDSAWLGAFRALFGVTIGVSLLRLLLLGWVDRFFVEPTFHFKYWGFEWVEPLSASGMHALCWVLAGLALSVAAGFCFRVSALLLGLGFTYLQLIDVATYLNHYYLVGLLALLLAVSPAGRAYSLDALLFRKPITHVPGAWLYLFRFQVGTVYTFAGLAKAHGDWLLHGHPLSIWLGSNTDLPVLGPLFTHAWAPLVMSWAGFLFDISIPWLLSVRRVRPFAYVAVLAFHTVVGSLFPIGMFPVIMVLSVLVFFPPNWPRALLARLLRRSPAESAPPRSAASPPWPRWATALALGYCTIQLLLPLRFLAYGGNVRWHEQGMRFSWRVMVREKNGSVTYRVTSKNSGRTWTVSPRQYLTRLQEREMSAQPDLILQLAHHVQGDYQRRGRGPVSVRADAIASLNGRRFARLIDPEVDLSQVEDGLGKASWIEPAPQGAPPPIRAVRSSAIAAR